MWKIFLIPFDFLPLFIYLHKFISVSSLLGIYYNLKSSKNNAAEVLKFAQKYKKTLEQNKL